MNRMSLEYQPSAQATCFALGHQGIRGLLHLLTLFSAIFYVAYPATTYAASTRTGTDLAILYEDVGRALLSGGAAVYFVPFATIGEDKTSAADWWRQCPLSRSVSADGLKQAAVVYQAMKTLGVNIGPAESGEHCASLTTAIHVTGNNTKILNNLDLNPIAVQRLSGISNGAIKSHVYSHLTTTHFNSVKILSGMPMTVDTAPHPVLANLSNGESAIFTNPRDKGLTLIARLNWQQWREMAEYLDRQGRAMLAKKRNLHRSKVVAK